MFTKKITVSLLNTKWEVIQRNLKLFAVPRRDEFIWFNGQYYIVLNIVHSIEGKGEILIVIEEHTIKTPEIIL